MNTIVSSLNLLSQLQTNTYIYAAITLGVAFFLAFLIANLIPWRGANDRSYIVRRVVWIIIGLVAALGYWVYLQTFVMPNIRTVAFQTQYATTTYISLGIVLVGYVLFSLLLMLLFRKSKFGSILGTTKP